ncbi:MAG: hypothetical protein ABIL09_10990 [Gemmatimonadota bacterium]
MNVHQLRTRARLELQSAFGARTARRQLADVERTAIDRESEAYVLRCLIELGHWVQHNWRPLGVHIDPSGAVLARTGDVSDICWVCGPVSEQAATLVPCGVIVYRVGDDAITDITARAS